MNTLDEDSLDSAMLAGVANIRSFLQTSPPICREGWLDISSLLTAVALLPANLPVTKESCKLLDEIFAILFHLQSPLRMQVAEDWLDENYIPVKEEPRAAKAEALELLRSLGLGQSSTPIRRL